MYFGSNVGGYIAVDSINGGTSIFDDLGAPLINITTNTITFLTNLTMGDNTI